MTRFRTGRVILPMPDLVAGVVFRLNHSPESTFASARSLSPGVPTAHRPLSERGHGDRSEIQAVHRKTLHLPRTID